MSALVLVFLVGLLAVDGSSISVELKLQRYAPQGGSATLRCEYNVPREALHKVDFQRGQNKLFQYIKDRKPPFKYYEILGAAIDKNQSNETQVVLEDLQLGASGFYSCEVSTIHPIFTRTSVEEEMTVIQPQRSAPKVTVPKTLYELGDVLEVNCSSSPAHPVPHITWLLNGAQVPDNAARFFPSQEMQDGEIISAATVQLTIRIDYTQLGVGSKLHLACVSTIPAFISLKAEPQEYADYQRAEVTVSVLIPKVRSQKSRGRVFYAVWELVLIPLLLLGIKDFISGR